MIKKFIEWWNQKEAKEEQIKNDYKEDKWSYRTTILRDLREISEILDPSSLDTIIKDVSIYEGTDKMLFITEGVSESYVRRTIGLKEMKIRNIRFNGKRFMWEVRYSEYLSVYQTHYINYNKEVIEPLIKTVQENYNNRAFLYIFHRCEDSILTVVNSLQSAVEHTGEIGDEVFDISKEIIEKLRLAVGEKQNEIDHVKSLQEDAVKKSIVNNLIMEKEYMDKFLGGGVR